VIFLGLYLILGLKPEKAIHVACGRAHTLLSTGKFVFNTLTHP